MNKKRWALKTISALLSVILVLQIIPMELVAQAVETSQKLSSAPVVQDVLSEQAEIVPETEEKQDAFTKTFSRADGSMVDIISSEPVHYYEDGEWKDIDNTLVKKNVDGQVVWQNKENSFTVNLPDTIESDSFVSLQDGKNKISFRINGVEAEQQAKIIASSKQKLSKEETVLSVDDNLSQIRYNDIAANTDVEYLVTETGLKENIILSSVPTTGYFVSFTFTAPGMTWNVNNDNSISFFNSELEEVFTMLTPYMFDDSGATSEDIKVDVYRSREGNIIKYTPSFEWLSDKSRVYPVTVDPSFTTNNRGFLITANAGNCDGEVGSYVYVQDFEKDGTAYNSQALLNLVYSRLQDEILISSASVRLRCEPLSTGGDFTNTIGISLANEPWAEETTTVIPQSGSDYLDVHTITEAGFYEFDITEAFNMWSMGLCDKNGFVVKPILGEGESCNVRVGGEDGYSVNRPYYTVNYRNVYGIRDDFEYHSIDMGRAGTAYVNDVTNVLVVVREELGLAGNVMPANLCRIYDSKLTNSVEYSLPLSNGAGTNWQWNYYGRLVHSSEKLRYYGADGTWMYFILEETLEDGKQKYVCPDSDKFTLWVEADATSLKNFENMYFEDEEYTYRFNSTGRIIKIIQKSSNASIDITYIASATIGKVTDGVGREFRLSVQVPANSPRKTSKIGAYTSSGEQITVTTPGSETPTNIEMTYTYDTSVAGVTLFKTATYADGETVRYEYNDNNDLVLIENIDGSRLEIEYTNGRVSAYTKRVYDAANEQYLFDERVEFSMITPYEHVFTIYDGDESTPVYTETVYYNKDFEVERRLDSDGEGSAEYYYSDGELKASVSTGEGTNLLASQTLTGSSDVSSPKLAISNARPIEGGTGKTIYKIDGSYAEENRAYKQIDVSSLTVGENDVTFNLEAWLKAPTAAHLNDTRFSGVMLEAVDAQGETTVSTSYEIDTAIGGWQYMLCCITVPAGTKYINVYVLNDYQLSTLYYAGLNFYKSDFSIFIEPDDDVEIETQSAETVVTCVCGSDCEYGENCPCMCTSAEACTCVCCNATSTNDYDSVGNLIYSATSDGINTISETYTYTEDKNFLATASDSLGNTVEYSYNTLNGTLTSFEDAEGNAVNYGYNAMLGLTQVTQAVSDLADSETEISNTYGYTDDLLTSITTGNGVNYTFAYDPFGNQKRVKVGNQTLASYSYGTGANRHRMASVTFGNGQVVRYTYDTDGNITAIECDSSHSGYEYTYAYHEGELSSATDKKTGFVTTYGETIYTVKDAAGNVVYQSSYDEDDNFVETAHGYAFTYDYAELTNGGYSETTGKTTSSFTVGSGSDSLTHTSVTDYFGRKESTVTRFNGWDDASKITTSYAYKTVGTNTTAQPEQISTQITLNGNPLANYAWQYAYDANGNIISEYSPILGDTTYYLYDEAGQLIDASNGQYETFTLYDNGGNIVSKTTVFEQSETYTYEYGNANWPDQLTRFNGKAITYDAIGNPLSYDGKTYTWTSGRELASITSADMSLIFKYNDSGLRTHKTVTQNGVTTTYTYAWSQDGRLISQSDGTTTLYFIYDENSEIIGFSKLTASSNEMYYYVKNLQGDVCAIVDSIGTTVVSYVYDAWGYLINITGSQATTLGVLNPIRYRGYYYDTETGYYYLQSRYYDPLWGRFINADVCDYLEETEMLFCNFFAYCNNNPIMLSDPSGMYAISLALSESHLKYNRKINISGKYINGQGEGNVAKMKYGLMKMKNNGCELIAVYNALLALDKGVDIAQIIYDFERNPAAIWSDGLLGTRPESIAPYLRKKGLKVKSYFLTKSIDKTVDVGEIYIISFLHSGVMIHTVMAVGQNNGKIKVYNRYGNKTKTYTLSSINNLVALDGYKMYIGLHITK